MIKYLAVVALLFSVTACHHTSHNTAQPYPHARGASHSAPNDCGKGQCPVKKKHYKKSDCCSEKKPHCKKGYGKKPCMKGQCKKSGDKKMHRKHGDKPSQCKKGHCKKSDCKKTTIINR